MPKLIAPVSSNFELCGWKNDTKGYDNLDYPNLLITDWSNPMPTAVFASAVCVKECPVAANSYMPEMKATPDITEIPDSEDLKEDHYAIMSICIPKSPPATV